MDGHLRACVQRYVRHDGFERFQNAQVLHQDRIHAIVACAFGSLRKCGKLTVGEQRVEREIDPDAAQMAVRHRRAELRIGKVPRAAARVEGAKAHINGVRTVLHGGDERRKAPGGGEKLGHLTCGFAA